MEKVTYFVYGLKAGEVAAVTPQKFKEMVQVKLELLRGCCMHKGIKKADIEKSIEEFIKKVDAVQF